MISAPVLEPGEALDPSKLQALSLWIEVQALLAEEAQLLDDRDYRRWLGLFTTDCLYWMPVDPGCEDGRLRLNVFYDDRARMEDRVARLMSGSAYSEEPPSLTARTFSAVQVRADEAGQEGDLAVRSNFLLLAHRRGRQRQLGGRYLHRLSRHDGRLRIAEKRVALLGSDDPQRPLTFLF
jgi:benzoate/toluate 1,2-dioxygenase beta subunit